MLVVCSTEPQRERGTRLPALTRRCRLSHGGPAVRGLKTGYRPGDMIKAAKWQKGRKSQIGQLGIVSNGAAAGPFGSLNSLGSN
jgi:hypothetical protein